MTPFVHAHATHPDWRMCLSMVLAQLPRTRRPKGSARLGFLYFTDHFAAHARALLQAAQEALPGTAWTGGVGIGIAASGVEYFDEPGIVLMLADLPEGSFRPFSGVRPLRDGDGFAAHVALVHADPATPDLAELITELSMRTATGYLFGGLVSSRTQGVHLSTPARPATPQAARASHDDGVFEGGLSGVAFDERVALVSRVTQGCQPIGPARTVTRADQNLVLTLDDQPALDVLLADAGVQERDPRRAAMALRHLLVGLTDPASQVPARPGQFGSDTRVRHLIGIDPGQRAIAIADHAEVGQTLAFCRRDAQAARRDLMRICAEIREELEPQEWPAQAAAAAIGAPPASLPNPPSRIAGAIYVSCTGRGGPHFGGPSAELQIVRHALGDVPLAGFFASGEIARHHLYGYTGVLTVFTAP